MTLVVVPRAVLTAWFYRPWSELEAAARGGVDGLRVYQVRASGPDRVGAVLRPGRPDAWDPGWDDWSELAFMRQGDSRSWGPDRAILLQQNW